VFGLVVVGSAVDYLPYFIVAFRELGVMGFGLVAEIGPGSEVVPDEEGTER